MAAWQADLPKALALVADTGVDGGAQHRVIERALGDLSAAAAGARCDRPLDAATVKELLERRLSGPVWHRSTPGGVTFCSMRHLRGVPCRVVILMGMNEGAFPLSRAIPSFHPAHRQPLPGDRDDRADGQHMFLEALLAAQERFVITRTGIADGGGELPPAAPVSDLLEALERRFLPSKNFAGVGDQVTVRHPMKPFSRRCFDGSDPRLFSYDADNLIAPSPVASPSVVLSEPDASGDSPTTPIDVSLSDLHAFWKDPVAFYVARHLHVKLPNIEAPVDCTDFVEADFLQRWRLGDEVTQARFRGDDRRVRKEVLRAKAAIPPGVPGELLLADVDAVASPIAAEGRRLAGGLAPENLEVSVPLVVDGRRVVVTGLLSPVVNGLALDCRYDKLQSSGLLRSWLKALVLCAAMPEAEGAARIGRDDRGSRVVRFRRPDDPVPLLASMVRLYLVGSHQPLPFVPDTAFKLATAWQDGDTGKEPWILEDARRQFEGPALEQSEIMRRAFLDGHAFDDPRNGFVAITREVVSPLLHHEEGEILP